MVVTDQYFPRGGKKPNANFTERKKFDFLGNSDKIGKKKRYRPKVIRENIEKDPDHLSDISYSDDDDRGQIKTVNAEKLSNKTMQEGMVLLGRVSQVSDMKLNVTLPNRLYGHVMACHISDAYNKLLQSYVNDETEDIKKLEDFFTIGEYVSVKITSITEENGKKIPTLSIMPQDVNAGILFSNIREGDILRGSVASSEDHGYIIDLGVANCRSFLPTKFVDKTLKINVGQVIWCVVKKCSLSPTNNIITLSNRIDMLKAARISDHNLINFTVSDLRPGMAMDFFVNKPVQNGAEGYVLSNHPGYIHTSQIETKLHTGKSVRVYLLYMMPITKLPFFTTREIFSREIDLNDEIHYKNGDIVQNSKVSKVMQHAVIYKFKNGIGIMPKSLSKCSDSDQLKSVYTNGSEHTVRILSYHLSDYAYICSDQEKVLQKKYFSYSDFKAGELVEATVKEVNNRGILVEVETFNGWIPDMLISDAGLNPSKASDSKISKYMRKFKVGDKINARVWKVNPSKKSLHLTTKPTLLSQDLKVLSSYKDAKIGHRHTGVIESVKQYGVIVKFFADVKALIHRNELSHEEIKDIFAAFHIGQIINCTIISVDADEEKMSASLIKPEVEDIKEDKIKSKKNKKRSHSEDGDAVENKELESTKKKKKKSDSMVCDDDEVAPQIQTSKKKKQKESSKIEEELSVVKEKKKKKSKERSNSEESEEAIINKKSKKEKKSEENTGTEIIEPNIKKNKKENNETKKKSVKDFNMEEFSNTLLKQMQGEDKNSKQNKDEKKVENITKDYKSKFSDMKSFWNLDETTISNKNKNMEDSESSSSDEEMVEQNTKKKKRLTNAEKIEKAREEEKNLREVEKKLTEADSNPNSSDQFDRLLLANPNSSQLWIAYMAFHLQGTEIDRARAVARKAINTISFREEEEKLNVWLALLNLENRFGTKESLNKTLEDAVQMNDSFKVHSKMVMIYADSAKNNELSGLIDTMLAKYKNIPEVYILIGEACFRVNMIEKARAVMQKAVSRLDNKKHVPILIKFAQMENANGDSERAETLFENMVGCMPQRVDIWNTYVDMLTKSNKIDTARLILERAVSQKLPARKMKLLYKKWIEIEEKHGNTDSIEKVRQMVVQYVEKNAK